MHLVSFRSLLFVIISCLFAGGTTYGQSSGVYQELYLNIGGGITVADLTNSAKFPNSPDQTGYFTTSFEAGINIADNYGQRCRALITAPLTGSYIFWISSDDASTLYLSTDESPTHKVAIASVTSWTSSREWTKEPNQQSAAQPLVAGQRYYIEALMKEGIGGDNLAVRWQFPNSTIEEPIPASRLSPFTGVATSPPTITGQPTNTTVMESSPATFAVQTSNFDPLTYQWQRNSNNISGANAALYTVAAVSITNNGDYYRCVLSNSLGVTISSNALLTVTPDTIRPTLVSATAIGYTGVQIVFSENLLPASATNRSNYVITNNNGSLAVTSSAFGGNNRTVLLTTTNQDPGAVYTVTVNGVRDASSNNNLILANSQITFTNTPFTVGYIRRELFYGISGNNVSDLTSSPNYPNTPSVIDYPPSMGWPAENIAENYGGRMWGYLVPPTNGTYTFAIRSDDASQLFLSTDEQATNKISITTEPGCCEAFDAHVSGPVTLLGGQKYYIEALMKEGIGGDYLYVAWKTPIDSAVWNVIPGSSLGNYLTGSNASITISQQPANTTVVSGQRATFSVVATGSSSVTTNLTYQWQRNGADIPGANGASYTTPAVFESDSGTTYQVVVSLPGKTVISSNATLNVLPDTFPPTLVNVQNVGTTNVSVSFSEAVEAATATNAANYALNNGIGISSARFGADTSTILLTVSPLTIGTNYTLLVSNVRDRAATPNTIAANSPFTFTATAYTPVDIGNPAVAGSFTVVSNGFNVIAGGTDIGSGSDQFQFSYQQRTGDFDIRVRVAQLALSDLSAKAGLMAREDLSGSSRFAAVLSTPAVSGTFFEWRDPAGALASSSGWFPPNFSQTWLRLQRAGNVFTGYASYDGSTWSQLGSVTIALPATIYFGLATDSHNAGQATAAQFRDLGNTPVPTGGLPTLNVEPLGPSTRRTGLVISEVMYHPTNRTDGRNLEFVELFNSTPLDEPLTGFRISGAIDYNFPAGLILKAGAFVVVAKIPGDIQAVYGITNVVGPYIDALQNGSGTVRLRNERDTILLEAEYDSKPDWPIAADGAGHSLVLARPSYGEGNASAWGPSATLGGSPGTGDPVSPSVLQNVVINEFLAHTDLPDVDYIELYNHSTRSNDLSGCFLSDTASTNKFTIPAGTVIPARGFVVFTENQLGFALSSSGEDIFFRDPSGRVLDAVRFEAQANGVATGRFPDGGDNFHELAAKTPGSTNAALLIRDIVINEIMYAPISGSDDDQYVELYNRGPTATNLSRWQFTDGIDFFFPSNAIVPANGYLVIAKNITNLLAHYPNLNSNNTVGNFSGSLSSKGERLALSMPDEVVSTNSSGNLKTNVIYIVGEEVTYGTGGRWGKWANGGGSSLELIDPRSDHRLAPNWADSDETAKATWTTIEATGLLDNGQGYNGGPIDNLQIGLTGEGECLLDNVQVIGPAGTNLIANSTFESGLANWVTTGTHILSALDTSGGDGSPNCLHIRASARGDTGANRIRTPLSATLSAGQVATIRGRYRWLRGMPEVVMRVHGNWLEAVGRFNVPANLGTPGARNSRAVNNAGPAIAGVVHNPIVPAPNQSVVVTARVHDYDGISSVQLKYRIDPATGFSTVTMRDDGTAGDAIAADGIFSGTIPGQLDGTIVAFYVQATDNFAPQATTFFPNDAPSHECLVRWGEFQPISSFGSYRLWLTQNNVNSWINRLVMSNDPIDGTFVYGNWRVIYNMGSHYAGSPYHQGFNSPVGGGCHYSLDLPDDDQLLGTGNFNKIHAPGNGPFDDDTIQREQTAYWMARQIGLPFNYRRYVNMFVNGQRRGTLMEDTQTPGSDVINSIFPDDSNGNLHKLQPWFEMDDSTSGQMGFSNNGWCTLNKYTTTNGFHKLARYRWNYLTRNASTSANEYTNVFNLIDAANTPPGAQYTANMEAIVDTEEWLRTFAIEHAVGNWDSFGNNNAQNMYGYKPEHGKWTLLIWDYNIVLGNSGSDGPTGDDLFKFNGADGIMPNFVNNPPFRRAYWRAYQDIINGPMRNEVTDPILDARYANFQTSGINVASPNSALKGWISTRRSYIQSQLNTVTAPFTITSNGGADFTTNNNLLMLQGTAPVGVKTITVNGVAFPPVWSTITNFTLSIPLATGGNLIVVQGFDSYGNAISGASDSITVTYSGPNSLPQDNIVFNEIMYNAAVPLASYVELFNNSTNFSFDLSNWRIEGIDFAFPEGTIIQPNAFLVVVQDAFVFVATYGSSIPIAGVYNGSLQNNGETLKLIKPGATPDLDQIIDIVRYENKPPWPAMADGFGPSLQLVDPTQDNYRVANWTATLQGSNPPQNLIVLTNTWKYNAAGTDLLTSWRSNGYDDSSWLSGRALFWGTNTASAPAGPTNTYIGFLNPKQTTVYFRTHFNFSGTPAGITLVMTNVIDDGAVFYLNAQEAFRWNMPAGTVTYSTFSSTVIGTAAAQGPFSFPATNLLQGDNVLGVEVHQGSSTSSDMAFGMTLDSSGGSSTSYTPGATNSVRATLPAFPLLWINEVLATNNSGITDNTGTREPWIELYNSGTNSIGLNGFYLTDNYTNLARWPFPPSATIASKQFLVVFADGESNQTTAGEFHTNFRLAAPAGSVALVRVNGGQTNVMDYLNYFGLSANRSYGSYPDGQPQNRQIFVVPTPGVTNNPATSPLPVMVNEWMADNAGPDGFADPADGLFQDWFELYNPNTNAVDLSGYTVTDNLSQPKKFAIPAGTSIGAGGFLLVWADNNTNQNGFNSDLHANFQLSNSGEAIGLYAPDGTPQSTLTFGQQYQNVSQGRWPDGDTNGVFYYMTNWTPRAANVLSTGTNTPPTLAFIGNKSVNEGSLLRFTNSASDSDIPAQTLTFSLDPGAPAAASINPASGVFAWTPGEADGPGSYSITIRVTDNGSPAKSAFKTISITVNEVNSPPILAPIGNRSVNEGSLLTFTATAADSDQPANGLAFSLDPGAPAGATINPSTGVFTWTPTEAQGPASYPVTIRVTDNGSPPLNDSETITITVNEVNSAPVLNAIGNKSVAEGATLNFMATASDPDLPAQTLTFSLDSGAPSGATINASSGLFTWTPTEAQGPSTNNVTVRVTDNGSPALSAFETISIVVNEVNSAPTLSAISNRTVLEGTLLTFTNNASDSDIPAQMLTFSLDSGAPAGTTVTTNGVFSWTPSETQGGTTNLIAVIVTDNGAPSLSATQTFTVTVLESNSPPILAAIANRTNAEGTLLSFTAAASDSDLPAQTLSFSLDPGAPSGASINANNGLFTWTPSEAQGPSTNTITVRVTDNGSPPQSDAKSFTVIVTEVNGPPTLSPIGNRSVGEGTLLTFTASASDSDIPAQMLTFSLDPGAPAGAAINPANGVFTWTPTEAQGPSTNSITVRVADNGSPALSASETISIVVNEVNSAPSLTPISNQTVNEGLLLSFTATASDADVPAQSLAFGLDAGAPSGASINASSGVFSWTPTEAQGPSTNTVTVRVTDNGSPALSDARSFTIIVNEVNSAPILNSIANQTINEETLLSFTASASDSDVPAQTLTFSLDAGAPSGATINATNGLFTWTPSEAQGPSTNPVTIRVTDNGTPALSAARTFSVVVNEVNSAPTLPVISNYTVLEGALLTFTNVATDSDLPAQSLTFNLEPGAPNGALINSSNGVFTWTPSETQGGTTNIISVRVVDNGSPSLGATQSFTVIVLESNSPPVIAAINDRTVAEGTLVSFNASASDPDIPAQTLAFSLDSGAPTGAAINSVSGAFTWTPSEAQGPSTNVITVRVADNGSPSLSATTSFTIIVTEVNNAPTLNAIGNRTVNESTLLTFTTSASDPDVPAQALTFSLDSGAPAGASINANSGIFTWTPTEAQGPSTNLVTVRVSDNGSPVLSDFETITIIVNEVNSAPVLAPIGSQTVKENTLLTFTATATDSDLPGQALAFSLDPGAPAGAAINSTNGVFTWTPTEAQGPSTNPVTVRVTDNGSPALSDFETITIVVTETNSAPVLAAIGNKTVAEGSLLTFTVSATDPDIPAQTLTFSLDAGAPTGASINSSNGIFTWTPTEAQGPSTNSVVIRVTDGGSPPASDSETIQIVVLESNSPPILTAVTNRTVAEGTLLSFTASASDSDIPAQSLSFTLDPGAPSGAAINATNGLFTWTPTEAQGPSTNVITIRVTDNGSPALSDASTFSVIVSEVNSPPSLGLIGNRTVNEGTLLTFTASASDSDIPAQSLTFSLDAGAPAGANINATNGVFTWTPTELQAPSTNTIIVRVTDNGSPALSATETITIIANEVNSAPVLSPIADQAINEGTLLSFTASASDSDVPTQSLIFSLDPGAPAGALINSTNGLFSWTPSEAQGPSTNSITIRVTDNGSPALNDARSFTVVVNEVNSAPALNPIANQTINEGALLSFVASASDADIPAQVLTFTLDPGAPAGASINSTNGLFTWTPTEAQGPSTNSITVRVTDNGSPALSDTRTFAVIVNEVNSPPLLQAIGDKTINEGALLSVTALATDDDLPAQLLTYTLASGAPAGAAINPTNGLFTWTPTEIQGPSTNSITVRVTDNGSPALSDARTFIVIVHEVNNAPVLASLADQAINEGSLLAFTASASDSDIPAQTLTFSLDAGAPVGASIDSNTGVFSWTPSDAQGPGTNIITVRVTDSGSPALSDARAFTVVVNEVNNAPVLASLADQAINEGTLLTFTATASDSDFPAQTLAFSLDVGAPVGAQINPTNGVFTWTPTEAQGPSTNNITVRVTDNGTPSLSDVKTFTVRVAEVNSPPALEPIEPQTTIEGQELTFTAIATDPDIPQQTLSFTLDPGAPEGAAINSTNGLFAWTPNEAQGPSTNQIVIRVTDNGTPSLSATQTISIIVLETNSPPLLDAVPITHVNEGTLLSVTISAHDSDIPAQKLTFSIAAEAPEGVSINSSNGLITWTPSEAQGPSTNTFSVFVSDEGVPSLSATQRVTIIVDEVNQPPSISSIPPQRVSEGNPLSFFVSATDLDIPAQTLSFSLDAGTPTGAAIDPLSGLFTWTPSEEQGPSTNTIAIRVTDNGSPALNAVTFVTIVVEEVNSAPTMQHIGDHIIAEGELFTLTLHASDIDIPAQPLTWHLAAGTPAGLSIDSASGVLTWLPTEAQGPSTNTVTVFVSDNGSPNLSAAETFTIVVTEVNSAPILAAISSRTVHRGGTVQFTASATDPDIPAQQLSFSLEPGAPSAATLNPNSGAFEWTADTAPGTNVVTIRVADNGSPSLFDSRTFFIVVIDELRISNISVLPNGSVVLSWNSTPGARYQLEYKDNLDAPQWAPLGDGVTANSSFASAVDDTQPGFSKIYRLRLIP